MTPNLNWKKIFLIVTDIAIACYLFLAVTAFNRPDYSHFVCTEVNIKICDNIMDGFLNVNDIKSLLEQKKIYPKHKLMRDVNTRLIEETLKQSPFVDEAQCYKTHDGHVFITLTQRMPILRVMSDDGDDYYIDDAGGIMRNTKYASNIIVATGSISHQFAQKTLKNVGNEIIHNKFWRNQVEQINVLPDATVEMVPRVGNHIIYIGKPVKLVEKLSRLEKFYRYGLSQAGWNKYSRISVEFDNQIICKKNNVTKK